MSTVSSEDRVPVIGHPWWAARRLHYNVALIFAGLLAEALYIAATVVLESRIAVDEFEITAFTIIFQAIGYLLAMLLANLCYFLGPLGERLIGPAHRSDYRARAYAAGLVVSVTLPMLWPLSAWIILWHRSSFG